MINLYKQLTENICQTLLIVFCFIIVALVCSNASTQCVAHYHIGRSHDKAASRFAFVSLLSFMTASVIGIVVVFHIVTNGAPELLITTQREIVSKNSEYRMSYQDVLYVKEDMEKAGIPPPTTQNIEETKRWAQKSIANIISDDYETSNGGP